LILLFLEASSWLSMVDCVITFSNDRLLFMAEISQFSGPVQVG